MAKHINIPNTNYWVLEGDSALTKAALESGRLINETSIENLDEVKALKSGDVVLDIGALVGDTAEIFLNLGCEVYAFEPYLDAFECLEHNCPKAKNYNVAVGDGRQMAALGKLGEDGSNFGTRMMELNQGQPSFRIDDLNLDKCDFAKIDCEGCEPMVLDGMKRTLKKFKPKLLIECYDTLLKKQGFRREDILVPLKELGYQYRVAIGIESNDRVDLLFY